MLIMQRFYTPILNYIYRFTSRIDEKWRNIIIEACFHVFALMSVVYASAPESEPRYILSAGLLAVITVLSVNKPLQNVKANVPMCAAWIIFAAASVFSFIDPANENHLASISLLIIPFGLPAFYYVWGSRGDYETVALFLSRAFANVITVYDIALLFIAPYKPTLENIWFGFRYKGTTTHCNYLAILMVAGFISCAYVILTSRRWFFAVPYAVGLCFCTVYTYFTVSRTSLFALAASFILVLLFSALRFRDKKRLCLTAVIALLTVASVLFARAYVDILSARAAIASAQAQSAPAEVFSAPVISTADAIAEEAAEPAPAETEPTEPAPAVSEPAGPSISSSVSGRFDFSNFSLSKLDSILSHRPTIWKVYLKHLGIRPKYVEKAQLAAEFGLPYYPVNAHNTYLFDAYRFGIFAGIGEALISLVAIVYSAIYMFRKKNSNDGMFFCILATCAFFLTAMMEAVGLPLNRSIAVLFYFALAPVFSEKPAVSALKLRKKD